MAETTPVLYIQNKDYFMCNETDKKDFGESKNPFIRLEQDEPTASEEIKKMLMTMRDLFFEGKHQEGHRASIIFLSGLYTGLNLKEKENYEKLNLQ